MTDDLSKKRELHDEAKALLDNKAFIQAILDLRKRYWEEFIDASTPEAILAIHARAKAHESIPTELTVIMNDYKMALARGEKRAS